MPEDNANKDSGSDAHTPSELPEDAIKNSSVYKDVLSESIERRNTIKTLKTQLEELQAFKSKVEESQLSAEEKTQKQIEELKSELTKAQGALQRRNKLDVIGTVLQGEGVVDASVSDLFLNQFGDVDLNDAGVVKQSIETFKQRHPGFFKQNSGPIITPDNKTTMTEGGQPQPDTGSETIESLRQKAADLQGGPDYMEFVATAYKNHPELAAKAWGKFPKR